MDGSNNTFADNIIASSIWWGFWLSNCSHSSFTGNNVSENSHGVDLYYSSYNSFYDNEFINNTIQVYDEYNASENVWDDGGRGNVWSDYLIDYPKAKEVDSLGVGNTPFVIDANNTDHYPLTNWALMTKPPTQKPNNPYLTNPYLLGLLIGIFAAILALSLSTYAFRTNSKTRIKMHTITRYFTGYLFLTAALLWLLVGSGSGGAGIGHFYGDVFFIIASFLLCDLIVLHFISSNKNKQIESPH
jgi:parallel beta-helix repeat protein